MGDLSEKTCEYCGVDMAGRRHYLAVRVGQTMGKTTDRSPTALGCSSDHAHRALAGERQIEFKPISLPSIDRRFLDMRL